MATFAGHVLDVPLTYDWAGDAHLDGIIQEQAPNQYWAPVILGAAPLTDRQPLAMPEDGHTGLRLFWPSDDLWHRIWVVPSPLDLGDVITPRDVQIEVWNSHLTAKTHTDLTVTGDAAGLTLVEAVARPRVWRATEWHVHTLAVTLDGAATIDVAYLFDFGDDTGRLTVTGRRVVPWAGMVNWREPLRERLSWLTDVLEAWDGSEQRIRLRVQPRTEYEFLVTAQGDERRRLAALLAVWQGRTWAVPVWTEGSRLTAPASPGALTVDCATADRGWSVGGLALLMAAGREEAVTVEAVISSTRLTLRTPLTGTWPLGTRVFPARRCRLQEVQQRRSPVPDLSEWRLLWRTEDAADGWGAADVGDTYRGGPVLTERPNWAGGVSGELERALVIHDPQTTARVVTDRTGHARERTGLAVVRQGRAAQARWRRLLYARAGRLNGVWVPTFERDLRAVADLESGQYALRVATVHYARYLVGEPGRRDLQIELSGGERLYRRVVGATVESATVEALEVDSVWPRDIALSEVRRISYLRWSRLVGDQVELLYPVPTISQCAVNFEGDLNEL